MSANKSWDIRPNVGRRVPVTADPVLPKRPQGGAANRGPSLKDRRRRGRRRLLILIGILCIVILGAFVYATWRPSLRIQNISIEGGDAAALMPLVEGALSGTYVKIIPRNSILLFSKQDIRNAILNAYPAISAVSVSRSGLTSVDVKVIQRASAFEWCGAAPDETAPCFETDAEGFVFAPSPPPLPSDGATTTVSHTLRVYAPLVEAASAADTPLRAHVANADAIPNALRFERAIVALGADVASIQMRNDEADVFMRSGTRITYVLGHEEAAAQLAATALPDLNLNDGSVDYVDLRFDGKVYFKKKGQ